MVHITAGLLDALLEMAEREEPDEVSIVLTSTPANAFEESLDVDDDTPILTTFYFPGAGRSVSSVFGVDLGTPSGRGRARFVSHPDGERASRTTDDFAAVVIVAVPPWDRESVRAYSRAGERLPISVVDADPPVEEARE